MSCVPRLNFWPTSQLDCRNLKGARGKYGQIVKDILRVETKFELTSLAVKSPSKVGA